MAVYRYRVTLSAREDMTEEGTVVAPDEETARDKLLLLELKNPKLVRLHGWEALRWRLFSGPR